MKNIHEDIIFRQRMRADDVMYIIFAVSLMVETFALTLITFMSIVIYPTFSALIYGILKIRYGLKLKDSKISTKILTIMVGIGSIIFTCFIFWLFFSEPSIGIEIVIYLIAYPIILTGIAGIVKGFIVREYDLKIRLINMIIGLLTTIIAISSYFYAVQFYFLYLISLIIILFLNSILRSAMYLSEFDLSIKNLHNFRYVIYIMSDYPKFIILQKIEEYNQK
ncbi:MAG: hypothetical protein ACFFD5_01105 [Candidatus Thorarchaeota archaeon]